MKAKKLQSVMEASQLSESGLGEWLRCMGPREAQLKNWREAVTAAAEGALQTGKQRRPASEAKSIKELEKDLTRKDKALAEAAALLVLSKKAQALWANEDASMGQTSDDESR